MSKVKLWPDAKRALQMMRDHHGTCSSSVVKPNLANFGVCLTQRIYIRYCLPQLQAALEAGVKALCNAVHKSMNARKNPD